MARRAAQDQARLPIDAEPKDPSVYPPCIEGDRLASMAEAGDHITFEIATTTDDQAAFLRHVARRPYRLVFQAATFGFIWLSFFVMQLAIGLISALFFARHGLFEAAQSYVTKGFVEDLHATAPVFSAFIVLLACLSIFVLIPRQCRQLAAKIMSGYPARPGETAPKTLTSRLRLSETGVESATDHERGFLAWSFVEHLIETKRHFFLMTGKANGLVIPKSSLDAASTDRFRDTIARRCAAARGR